LAPKKSQPPVSVLSEVKDNIPPLGEVPNNCSSPEEPPGVPEVKPKKDALKSKSKRSIEYLSNLKIRKCKSKEELPDLDHMVRLISRRRAKSSDISEFFMSMESESSCKSKLSGKQSLCSDPLSTDVPLKTVKTPLNKSAKSPDNSLPLKHKTLDTNETPKSKTTKIPLLGTHKHSPRTSNFFKKN